MGNTPWSALFMVAQMYMFDGSASLSESMPLATSVFCISMGAATEYSLRPSGSRSRSWKTSPKTAAGFALLISSTMSR